MIEKKIELCRLVYAGLLRFYVNSLRLVHLYRKIDESQKANYFYACCFDKHCEWVQVPRSPNHYRQYSGKTGCVSLGLVFLQFGMELSGAVCDSDLSTTNWESFEGAYEKLKKSTIPVHLRQAGRASTDLVGYLGAFRDNGFKINLFSDALKLGTEKFLSSHERKFSNSASYILTCIRQYESPHMVYKEE